ncbi:AAA family ATPase [Oceanibacterium hippocampi]|uniref:Regulatory protein RepA n=1 Tax=Oceanibacterium hippocampi TaxID=745714 RepID=A0A1Y5U2K4_9PROT|nr:AAA family ATPase [Oceanibacterium hippocampi]SLN77377.1 Regulatory protein RepA [Oceanibacterium hippocampi]
MNETRKIPFPLDITAPVTLQGQPVPEREWIVPGWIPSRSVTMIGGDGGQGKTLLAQQLMTACAIGQPWLGVETTPCRAFGLFAEDETAELHHRQAAINAAYGVDFRDLERMEWTSRVGLDNSLGHFDQFERFTESALLGQLHAQLAGGDVRLCVLDSLHDLFTGSENSRTQARAFIGALRCLATEMNGAIVLTAHPSRAGMADGSGYSGSTAWNGAVRSRLYLKGVEGAKDRRKLTRQKSNYAPAGEVIDLRFKDGILAPLVGAQGVVASIRRGTARNAFMACLWALMAQGRDVSESSNASNFAPRVMASMADAEGYAVGELLRAMNEAFDAGDIRLEPVGPPSRNRRVIRPTDG